MALQRVAGSAPRGPHRGAERLADLAARSSTPKTRAPAALQELETHGYLRRLARLAPHLAAALPERHPPAPDRPASSG
ncbi:helix-turn-helix domain-containing protein [Kocuria sp. SM24M-10]|uniref:helix-turn-helix domain-containing protein n=1 Tax=Kocuria sp. SM24M-10 TaxID=1660349 RepID=UPI003528BE60